MNITMCSFDIVNFIISFITGMITGIILYKLYIKDEIDNIRTNLYNSAIRIVQEKEKTLEKEYHIRHYHTDYSTNKKE